MDNLEFVLADPK
jgi:hypothetical protein